MASKVERAFKNWETQETDAKDWATFLLLSTDSPCVKNAVITIYKAGYPIDKDKSNILTTEGVNNKLASVGKLIGKTTIQSRQKILSGFNVDDTNKIRAAAAWVWANKRSEGKAIVDSCALARKASDAASPNTSKDSDNVITPNDIGTRPFDKRLDRLEKAMVNKDNNLARVVPFSSDFAELSTTGYLISKTSLERLDNPDKEKALENALQEYQKMAKDELYLGVPSLQNQYATIRLYGTKGGKYLLNEKGERRWYEVDITDDNQLNFASTPTTSGLISWGNGDPHGRTPYQFTDFVFCKYWNKIANNRLITLRRYAAPILDNLKFPGMAGSSDPGNPVQGGQDDTGSTVGDSIPFPPMASALTYFGGESENTLNNILKFTTGVLWDDAQASVWEVNTDQVPDGQSGAGGIYGGIAKFAEILNVAGGNFDRDLIMNKGQLPPDPYNDGPYENRIRGPINRIDSVKKRKPGLAFEWGGLNLSFEYVARPIGGINPKAVLLDILSNFLIIGSASAVFFGGAHRFMAAPHKYPFLGGNEGIEKWYKGDPIGWGLTVVKQFAGGGSDSKEGSQGNALGAGSNILESMKGVFDQLFSGEKGSGFGALTALFSGGTGNLISNEMAKKSVGQVPFMSGMKAILTGEPIGEWHVTIGNPLNPIAMIGNLICEGITVEFNEELGPDDFPTEMKITVKLNHAMARDRDAIESVFNRGMGRIYTLPDSFLGSADYQTAIDNATQKPTQTGDMPNRRMGILYSRGMDSGFIPKGQLDGKPNPLGGEVSVWNRESFNLGISENSATQFLRSEKNIFKSVYRTADWIAQRSLQ